MSGAFVKIPVYTINPAEISFSSNYNHHTFPWVQVCGPSGPPLRIATVLYYFMSCYRNRGIAPATGAKATFAVAPKSVMRNFLMSPDGNLPAG
jgi:hypothetical protein